MKIKTNDIDKTKDTERSQGSNASVHGNDNEASFRARLKDILPKKFSTSIDIIPQYQFDACKMDTAIITKKTVPNGMLAGGIPNYKSIPTIHIFIESKYKNVSGSDFEKIPYRMDEYIYSNRTDLPPVLLIVINGDMNTIHKNDVLRDEFHILLKKIKEAENKGRFIRLFLDPVFFEFLNSSTAVSIEEFVEELKLYDPEKFFDSIRYEYFK